MLSTEMVNNLDNGVLVVGTALKEQVFEEGKVPVDGTDWIVDILVTGDGRVIRNEEARKMRG